MKGLTRREQRLCACLLAMILCVAGTGAWLTWRAVGDAQVQPQGLVVPAGQTSQPRTIDGAGVASAVAVTLLAGVMGVAYLVVARHRCERVQSPEGLAPEAPRLEGSGQPLAEDPLFEERATALPEAETLLDLALVPAPRPATLDGPQEVRVAVDSTRRPLASPLPERSSSFPAPARDSRSENIFDRRAARRVPYVQSAWLWWGDANGPVTVQDLSATGLRLRFPGTGPTQAPELGQSLRISFPVSGTTVQANGRVQWKRTVDGGAETGLRFVDLAAGDQELIQAVILAAD